MAEILCDLLDDAQNGGAEIPCRWQLVHPLDWGAKGKKTFHQAQVLLFVQVLCLKVPKWLWAGVQKRQSIDWWTLNKGTFFSSAHIQRRGSRNATAFPRVCRLVAFIFFCSFSPRLFQSGWAKDSLVEVAIKIGDFLGAKKPPGPGLKWLA